MWAVTFESFDPLTKPDSINAYMQEFPDREPFSIHYINSSHMQVWFKWEDGGKHEVSVDS